MRRLEIINGYFDIMRICIIFEIHSNSFTSSLLTKAWFFDGGLPPSRVFGFIVYCLSKYA